MALIYPSASITPTKQELLDAWLPTQPWYPGGPAEKVAAYRFDDPAGEVGIEGFVLKVGDGFVHQVLTYRAGPLAGAEPWLVGTTEHTVLGTRWVHDVAGDPVGLTALAAAALTGGQQADLFGDGETEPRPALMTVRGSGAPGAHVGEVAAVTAVEPGPVTVVRGGGQELLLVRVIGASLPAGPAVLHGEWPGGSGVLAGVRRV